MRILAQTLIQQHRLTAVFALVMAVLAGQSASAQPTCPPASWTQIVARTSSPPNRVLSQVVGETTRARLVLFGGQLPPFTELGDTWTFDGTQWTQANVSTSPEARHQHRMVFDPQRSRTVLFGGLNGQITFDDFGNLVPVQLNDTWEWDGRAWARSSADGPPARTGPAMSYAGNGQTVLFGGVFDGSSFNPAFNDTWVYNGTTWVRVSATNPPQGRVDAAMAYDPIRNVIVMFGGYATVLDPDTGFPAITFFDETWELRLSGSSAAWTRVTPAQSPPARFGATMLFDPVSRQMFIFGATSDLATDSPGAVWSYNGTTWIQRTPGQRTNVNFLPEAVFQPAAGPAQIIATSTSPSQNFRFTGTEYIPISQPLIADPTDYILTYDTTRSQPLLLEGTGARPVLWRLTQAGWSLLNDASTTFTAPAVAAFDPVQDRLIALTDGQDLNRTYSYSFANNTWTQVADAGPSFFRTPAMVYDPISNRMVFFGVRLTTDEFGLALVSETWVLNSNNTWQQLATTSDPGPRHNANITYDSVNRRVLLYGGRNDLAGQFFTDLWAFDGANWTLLNLGGTSPTDPPAVSDAVFAFDDSSGNAVLYGGRTVSSQGILLSRNDTWVFNGTAWARQNIPGPTRAPNASGRSGLRGVYDARQQHIVFFGGNDVASGTAYGDTWAFSQTPVRFANGGPVATINVRRESAVSIPVSASAPVGPITYRWLRNGVALADGVTASGSTIAGANTSTLRITSTRVADSGVYQLRASTPCGDALSTPARLVVDPFCLADFDRSGTVNSQDIFAYLQAWFSRCLVPGTPGCAQSADVNADGAINASDIFDFLRLWYARC